MVSIGRGRCHERGQAIAQDQKWGAMSGYNQTPAPIVCIKMLAIAIFRLRSKFDIANRTRGLWYLNAILL
jgi:hypothetical protein